MTNHHSYTIAELIADNDLIEDLTGGNSAARDIIQGWMDHKPVNTVIRNDRTAVMDGEYLASVQERMLVATDIDGAREAWVCSEVPYGGDVTTDDDGNEAVIDSEDRDRMYSYPSMDLVD